MDFGVCIDIVDICFGIVNGRISSILTELSARNTSVFYFQDNKLSQSQWIFTKFICPWHYNGWVLSFHVLFVVSIYSDCRNKKN